LYASASIGPTSVEINYLECKQVGDCKKVNRPMLTLDKGDNGQIFVSVEATQGAVRWQGHINLFADGQVYRVSLGPFTVAQDFPHKDQYYWDENRGGRWIYEKLS